MTQLSLEYCYIYYINKTQTDFEQDFPDLYRVRVVFIEMDLLQKMFLSLAHERNAIYSELVNNPFNTSHGNWLRIVSFRYIMHEEWYFMDTFYMTFLIVQV